MRAVDRRLRVHIFASRYRHFVILLVRGSIDKPQQSVLSAHRDYVAVGVADLRAEQRADLAEIAVVHVVADELTIPLKLAAASIERDKGICVEIIARPHRAVETRSRTTHRHVEVS